MPPKLESDSATERVQIVATARWMERIDDWRRLQPEIPNRSKAIRMLVEMALENQKKG